MNDLTISLIQQDLLWEDTEQNLDRFAAILSELPETYDLILLPEMFNTGFSMNVEKIAEAPGGKTMQWMADTASQKRCVVAGTLVIRENGRYFNRLVWMRPDGTFEAYDKRHLFRFGGEHLSFAAGKKQLVVEIKGWKVCPLVCYDLRFPVWSRNLYREGRHGYDLLIFLANWPESRIRVWKSLLVARAIDNQCYVAGVNRTGTDGNGIVHPGDSMVVDHRGQVLAALPAHAEAFHTVTLDYQALAGFRAKFPVAMDWDDFNIIL